MKKVELVEKYMPEINAAIKRAGLKEQNQIDIYNRCYEAVHQAIKDTQLFSHCGVVNCPDYKIRCLIVDGYCKRGLNPKTCTI